MRRRYEVEYDQWGEVEIELGDGECPLDRLRGPFPGAIVLRLVSERGVEAEAIVDPLTIAVALDNAAPGETEIVIRARIKR